MPPNFQPIFDCLRGILQKQAAEFTEARNTASEYALEAPIGPATLQAWHGKAKRQNIPVAWVQIGKSYVSYHLMGVENPRLLSSCSKELKARMQGKTCFNFKSIDLSLLPELTQLTRQSLEAMRAAGYIT